MLPEWMRDGQRHRILWVLTRCADDYVVNNLTHLENRRPKVL